MTPRTIEALDQRGIADRFLTEGRTIEVGPGFAGLTMDLHRLDQALGDGSETARTTDFCAAAGRYACDCAWNGRKPMLGGLVDVTLPHPTRPPAAIFNPLPAPSHGRGEG
jgi:hypothetical protein